MNIDKLKLTYYWIKHNFNMDNSISTELMEIRVIDNNNAICECYNMGWDCPVNIPFNNIIEAIEIINPFIERES